MSRDLFTNKGSTTVSAGGTDAPVSGTTQTWTVVSSASFPAADNTAVPATVFYIVDPDADTEIIQVTNVSGASWDVVRGAEGTTPVSHTAGFTVNNVVTASWLQELEDRLKDRVFDVLEYGALGDGSANDTAAFQAAWDAAGTAATSDKGALLVIPPGNYKLNGSVTPSANVKVQAYGAYIFNGDSSGPLVSNSGSGSWDGVEWYGGILDNKGQSAATDVTYNIFSVFDGDHVTFKDITCRNVAAWHAIDLSACTSVIIDGCRFEGFVDNTTGGTRAFSEAIQIDDNPADVPCRNILVTNCYMGPAVDGSGLGAFGRFVGGHTDSVGNPYENIRIIGNTIQSPGVAGIQAYSWNNSVIANNIIIDSAGSGIVCTNTNNTSNRVSVTGNVIKGHANAGIDLTGSTGTELIGYTVTGNTIESASSNDSGIKLTKVLRSSITGNTIRDGGDDGIEVLTDSNNNIIANNYISDVDVVGIQVDTSDENLVAGNSIYNVGTRGIWISNSSIRNTVGNNLVIGAGRATNNTYGCFEVSNSANHDNVFISNTARKFGSGNEALTPVVFAGSNPTGCVVVGNAFEGWSATHASNFTLNGATINTSIGGTTTANNTTA